MILAITTLSKLAGGFFKRCKYTNTSSKTQVDKGYLSKKAFLFVHDASY